MRCEGGFKPPRQYCKPRNLLCARRVGLRTAGSEASGLCRIAYSAAVIRGARTDAYAFAPAERTNFVAHRRKSALVLRSF